MAQWLMMQAAMNARLANVTERIRARGTHEHS
jgi:hypothetical protein